MKKICVVSATRAEYGLLKNLMQEMRQCSDLKLQLIVTGAHLSVEFGYTIHQIIEDGFIPDKKIEMLLSSDSVVGITKSMGLALIGFAEAFTELQPDLVVVLGDRYELLPIVISANMANIPIAHLNGGELTEGSKDETFRHAITKLSHLHFTALPEYAERVIRMGEQPERVFNVGVIGLDNLHSLPLLSKETLASELQITFLPHNLLITYHPDTNDALEESISSFNYLLDVLAQQKDTFLIFTKANADVGGRRINELIENFVAHNQQNAKLFESLGRLRYLSVLQYVDAVIGNSSSGIVEAASFKCATINLGDRQKGRVRGCNVIDVQAKATDLELAFKKVYSDEFQQLLKTVKNPYGEGGACKKIISILRSTDLTQLIKKPFFDGITL